MFLVFLVIYEGVRLFVGLVLWVCDFWFGKKC